MLNDTSLINIDYQNVFELILRLGKCIKVCGRTNRFTKHLSAHLKQVDGSL